jgi:hypothetical protein
MRAYPRPSLQQAVEWVEYGLELTRSQRTADDHSSDFNRFMKPAEMWVPWVQYVGLDCLMILWGLLVVLVFAFRKLTLVIKLCIRSLMKQLAVGRSSTKVKLM